MGSKLDGYTVPSVRLLSSLQARTLYCTVMTRRWARFSGRSYAAGELEFGAFYAETGAAGTAPDDLQHGGGYSPA